MRIHAAKLSSGGLHPNALPRVIVVLAVLLVICATDGWYQRDDTLARVTVGLALVLFATGFLLVREGRRGLWHVDHGPPCRAA